MCIWYCTCFTGYYPIGVAAIVFAKTNTGAARRLNTELKRMALPGDAKAKNMVQVTRLAQWCYDQIPNKRTRNVIILNDGNY